MNSPVALFLSALFIVSEASAQTVFETQEGLSVESCVEAVENAEASNGFLLFLGADSCHREGLAQDGAFLSWAGWLRSVLDMLMFEASGEEAERVLAELRDFLSVSNQAGIAPAELYRDEPALRRLIARLWDWRPRSLEGYDPGWAHREPPSFETYGFFVGQMKVKSSWLALSSKPALRTRNYYAATTELAELQRRSTSLEVDGDDRAKQNG